MKKVVLETLGCKVNQYETQAMRELLESGGYSVVDNVSDADIYVVNTCVVTHTAEKDSLLKINKAIKDNPNVSVLVTGCLAEQVKEIAGVKFVVGNSSKNRILEVLGGVKKQDELAVSKFHRHTRAFIKIEDGCENFCSYCVVPHVRGKIKSRDLKDITEETLRLVKNGYKEIVLTGINLGAYGKDLKKKIDLADVLKVLVEINGVGRIRLSSIEPDCLNDSLINLIGQAPGICNHLHIPLQSGDDEILKKMNRKYSADDFRRLVRKLKDSIKDIGITTDIIVGFPGEKEPSFENTCRLAEEAGFLKAHIFTYSDRKGTKAYDFADKVPEDIKEKRYNKLKDICDRKAKEFVKESMGKELKVLVEDSKDKETGYFKGLSGNYIRILLENAGRDSINKIVKVRINKLIDGSALFAKGCII